LKSYGTGALEIKSGYGLSVEAEIKMLRVIKRLKETCGIEIKATFLGAHAFPKEYKENHRGYIDLKKGVEGLSGESVEDFLGNTRNR
jgi:imidazolonepropionase